MILLSCILPLFYQRHIMSHLQIDYSFLVRYIIQLAMQLLLSPTRLCITCIKIEVKLVPLCNSIKILILWTFNIMNIQYQIAGCYNHGMWCGYQTLGNDFCLTVIADSSSMSWFYFCKGCNISSVEAIVRHFVDLFVSALICRW